MCFQLFCACTYESALHYWKWPLLILSLSSTWASSGFQSCAVCHGTNKTNHSIWLDVIWHGHRKFNPRLNLIRLFFKEHWDAAFSHDFSQEQPNANETSNTRGSMRWDEFYGNTLKLIGLDRLPTSANQQTSANFGLILSANVSACYIMLNPNATQPFINCRYFNNVDACLEGGHGKKQNHFWWGFWNYDVNLCWVALLAIKLRLWPDLQDCYAESSTWACELCALCNQLAGVSTSQMIGWTQTVQIHQATSYAISHVTNAPHQCHPACLMPCIKVPPRLQAKHTDKEQRDHCCCLEVIGVFTVYD